MPMDMHINDRLSIVTGDPQSVTINCLAKLAGGSLNRYLLAFDDSGR